MDLAAELSIADHARLDRLAISASLQDLGYLTLQRIRRPPKKPKRLSREKLARRVAKFRRKPPSRSPPPPKTLRHRNHPSLLRPNPKILPAAAEQARRQVIQCCSNERPQRRTADRPSGSPVRSP